MGFIEGFIIVVFQWACILGSLYLLIKFGNWFFERMHEIEDLKAKVKELEG
jgi:hypothetical protein